MTTCRHGVHGGAKYVILYGPDRMILLKFQCQPQSTKALLLQ